MIMVKINYHTGLFDYWADDIVRCDLFRPDGIARNLFENHRDEIIQFAYIPGKAWVAETKQGKSTRYQAFTHPDFRRQGLCEHLSRFINPELFDPIYDKKI